MDLTEEVRVTVYNYGAEVEVCLASSVINEQEGIILVGALT